MGQEFGIIEPDGTLTDESLWADMLGPDTWPQDVDYATTPLSQIHHLDRAAALKAWETRKRNAEAKKKAEEEAKKKAAGEAPKPKTAAPKVTTPKPAPKVPTPKPPEPDRMFTSEASDREAHRAIAAAYDKEIGHIEKEYKAVLGEIAMLRASLIRFPPLPDKERAEISDKIVETSQKSAGVLKRKMDAEAVLSKRVLESLKVENPQKVNVFGMSKMKPETQAVIKDAQALLTSLNGAGSVQIDSIVPIVRGRRYIGEYNHGLRRIQLQERMSKEQILKTTLHEMGHAIEHNHPEVLAEAKQVIHRMFGVRRRDPARGFVARNRRELARTYGAKIYPGGRATELLSTGLELYATNPAAFAKNNPDHFAFVYRTLRKLQKTRMGWG